MRNISTVILGIVWFIAGWSVNDAYNVFVKERQKQAVEWGCAHYDKTTGDHVEEGCPK